MFQRMHGDGKDVAFGRMESLRADFAAFLATREIKLTDEMTRYIRFRDRTNASNHLPYGELYDDATRDLVATRDADVIERFGYRFDLQVQRQGSVRS